jgi:glycosyltransferase involved in cell wall biosynthesis
MRVTRHDVLYLNSFFNTAFTFMPLLARWFKLVPVRPTIVASRGEFSVEALKLKQWKKIPFTRLVFWLGLFDNILWQASTKFESADIKRLIGIHGSKIHVATNIAVASDLTPSPMQLDTAHENLNRENGKYLRVCFLSRIAPMKNLDYAIKILAQVRAPVHFHMYGPKESLSYWNECDVLITKLPSNIQVSYGGSVENSQVRSVIARHDLFFVPSRGENFGHVFMEALSAGVPILVSDQTPWRRLQERMLGWDIPLEKPEEFVRAVEEAAAFDESKRVDMRARCIAFARDKADDIEALNMNRSLFLTAIGLRNKSVDSV